MSEETISKVYGIDLGTTYSAISCINEDGKPEIIKNMEGFSTTPSVVLYEESSDPDHPVNVTVGETAKEGGKTMPDNVVSFIKQEMGTGWTREIAGMNLTPVTVSAHILEKLVRDAKLSDHDVKNVIITCPAYFDAAQREATKSAGEIAGLNVLQIIDEPVAAAMHYGLNKVNGNRKAIVYDLGGGTFDVSVVEITNEDNNVNVKVICSDGNHRLGGKNWDERIVKLMARKFAEANGCSEDELMSDIDTLYDLQTKAERIKISLTTRPKAIDKIVFGGSSQRIEITREEFDNETKDLLETTVELTQKTLDFAKTKGVDVINDFLLVGGSTFMPQVQEMVKEKFSSAVDGETKIFDPNEAVAKGAAMFAFVKAVQLFIQDEIDKNKREGISDAEAEQKANEAAADTFSLPTEEIKKIGNTEMTTVASRSYGIRALNKDNQHVVFNMIKKQDTVPAAREHDFPVSAANAEKIPLIIYANNSVDISAPIEESAEIGQAEMFLPPNTPKGAIVRVKFTLTLDGVLEFSAIDIASGTTVNTSFDAKNGLSQEEIAAARNEIADLVFS